MLSKKNIRLLIIISLGVIAITTALLLKHRHVTPAQPTLNQQTIPTTTHNSITNQTTTPSPVIDNQTISTGPVTIPTENTTPGTIKNTWNLQEAPIRSVIAEVSKETGKNFIIDPSITGNVTMVSQKPIGPNTAYQTFLAVVQNLGYAVLPAAGANTFKIIPSSAGLSGPVKTDSLTPSNELMVRVIPVQNESATQLAPILAPFEPTAKIQAYQPGNVLIVSGTANDIINLNNLMQSIDTVSNNDIDIVPVKNASATDLANTLNTMENGAGSGGAKISISADQRSNSILLSGNQEDRLKTKALIAQLDQRTGTGAQTQVIRLNFLTAKDFAPVLGSIVQNSSSVDSPNPLATMAYNKTNNSSVQAVPDENALIVTAPPQEMQNIKNIVAQLDVRPSQVLIEAAIVEISESAARHLGVEWGSLSSDGSSLIGAATDAANPSGISNVFTNGVGIIHHGDFQAIVHALNTSTSADILSTPSIVVLNNHEANIDVGKQINVQSQAQAVPGAATGSTITSTFQQQQVALTLDVKPQVNIGSNTVELAIKQKNDTLQDENDTSTNPIINISGITTDVDVHSNDILVLGGLIKNQLSDTESKIPVLGNIPLIGNAFKYKTHGLEKKYLMVFIHPVIMNNSSDDTTATNSKYDYIRKIQLAWQKGSPTDTGRLLAPRETSAPTPALPTPFSEKTNS